MSGKNRFVCSVILVLVIASSKSQQNSMKNEEEDDNLIRYEMYMDSTTNYSDEIKTTQHLYKEFINNTQYDKMQYEFNTNNNREDNDSIQYELDKPSMQNREDDKQISMNSHTNSTNVNHKKNFMSQAVRENLIERNNSTSLEVFKNSSKDSNKSIVPSEMCHNDTCIQLCCPLGDRLVEDKCTPEGIEYIFPNVYTNDSMQSDQPVDELFHLAIYDPCQERDHTRLAEGLQYEFMIFANGSIYLSYYKIFVKSTPYCLAIVEGDKFEVVFCSEIYDEIKKKIDTDSTYHLIIYVSFQIMSILFLLSIFLVYSILPQLRNKHSFMVRNYSAALSVGYGFDVVNVIINTKNTYPICVTIAFLNYFCLLAGSFWLFMISFDMWCTFRGFCTLQRNVKQREKRNLMYYTIFAWGCPFIFAVFCVIMDSVSKYVPEILRPEFRLGDCWFNGMDAFVFYYYGPKSVCLISSICLFISTALKIARYEKDTGLRLTDSESNRYNDNKKWFSLYLKLFIIVFIMVSIVMGVNLSMMTMSNFGYIFIYIYPYFFFITSLTNTIQNLCTFIIFVCKKDIKMMLLKRFGCGLFPQARSDTNVTSSTITSEVSMQENTSSNAQETYHVKNSSDGTEF